jgi:uncharacterized protein YwbE
VQLLILKTSAENEVNVVRVKAIAHRTTITSIRKLLTVSDTCHFGGARNKFQNAENMHNAITLLLVAKIKQKTGTLHRGPPQYFGTRPFWHSFGTHIRPQPTNQTSDLLTGAALWSLALSKAMPLPNKGPNEKCSP